MKILSSTYSKRSEMKPESEGKDKRSERKDSEKLAVQIKYSEYFVIENFKVFLT